MTYLVGLSSLGLVVIAFYTVYAFARCGFMIVHVTGGSMEPSLHHGDRLLLRRGRGRLTRGSIVALRTTELTRQWPADYPALMVKRLVAGPGDPLPGQDRTVPPGHVYVLGDTPNSLDSRTFGAVPVHLIAGRVVRTLSRDSAGG